MLIDRKRFACLAAIFLGASGYAGGSQPDLNPAVTPQGGGRHVVPLMMTQNIRSKNWKQEIDTIRRYSQYTVVHASLRNMGVDKDIMRDEVHDILKEIVQYGRSQGISPLADLDARLAVPTLMEKYPGELQQMLVLREVDLVGRDTANVSVAARTLQDHYVRPYPFHAASFEKAVAFNMTDGVIDPSSLVDITAGCESSVESNNLVHVDLSLDGASGRSNAVVFVTFTYAYPDVFGPHLLEFEREIAMKYADVPFGGANKNEWGFPNAYSESNLYNQYWYSPHQAVVYARKTGGRSLIDDILLMDKGMKGRETERILAINHFGEMIRERNGAIEENFYRSTKEAFGPQAIVSTHPTWFPYPERREFKKNGLDWWVARRDWAQVDEVVPFAVRTALAKKWNSPVWISMHYMPDIPPANFNTDYFEQGVWSGALAGGRVNRLAHGKPPETMLAGDFLRAESRVQLLNYIDPSPLDCPVAVIFGHAAAMNWADRYFEDVGMTLADEFWKRGFPADLIPTSEIDNHSLKVDADGFVTYGRQRYTAVVLYNPEFEKPSVADFLNQVDPAHTGLFRMGNWTRDFNGQPFAGNAALPDSMAVEDNMNVILEEVTELLARKHILHQTPATEEMEGFGHISYFPPAKGHCRLLDGTYIKVAGEKSGAGDSIVSEAQIGKHTVSYDVIGVIGVRLGEKGRTDAFAASGLKSFKAPGLEIDLDQRIDLALWHNAEGLWEGVIQGWNGEIPAPLLQLTTNWSMLSLPDNYPEPKVDIVKRALAEEGIGKVVETVADIDGNTYRAVKIGTQTWMVDNLRTTKYNDGEPVEFIGDNTKSWYANRTGAYAYHGAASVDSKDRYGLFYNWHAASSGRICPSGWRLPTAEDWETLISCLTGQDALKKDSFNPVGGGYRCQLGTYSILDEHGYWWSASGPDRRAVWDRADKSLYITHGRKIKETYGLSIRCIKE